MGVVETVAMAQLVRDGVVLAYDDVGAGQPPLVFLHGIACHRGFWTPQVRHFAGKHRVLAVDLRGHGDSDAPEQRYTIPGFADDVLWMCSQLEVVRPVVVGHSLGGLVALELAGYPKHFRAAVLIDSVLLPGGARAAAVGQLVAGLRSGEAERTLRDYFASFFAPRDDPGRAAWILDQVVQARPHVISSVWNESLQSWSDAAALERGAVPLLYLDAGTANADLERAVELCPALVIGRTVGSGHFSPLEVPDQVNAMVGRFLAVGVGCGHEV